MAARFLRFAIAAVLSLFLFACDSNGSGGGNDISGSDDGSGGGGDSDPGLDPGCGADAEVCVAGTALYEFVPAVTGAGGTRLAYEQAELRPIRGAEVVTLNADTHAALATSVTDETGGFALAVPEDISAILRVRAVLSRRGSPGWDVQVVDNTRQQGVWTAQGEAFATGSEDFELEFIAGSGWDGNGYSGARAAAPFAILDSVYVAMRRVLEVDADASFPPLTINWSPDNRSCNGSDYPYADGCITTSHFANFGGNAGRNIFVLGDENEDTDEFDRHVIIHEWGHYYESAFARSDSIGGPHTLGDHLDPRVAFGEGWGNAWSGIATDDPVYVDTSGSGQARGFSFSVEANGIPNAGWWSEGTVQRILFDIYDAANDDGVALGFAPMHEVLTNEQRETSALTTVFPFIHFLKQRHPENAAAIDQLVADSGISPVEDEWGSGRTLQDNTANRGTASFVVPVYAEATPGEPLELCTTDAYGREVMEYTERNRLGARRYARFTPELSGIWNIRLGTSSPDGADPDFFVHHQGRILAAGLDDSSRTRVESETVTLSGGQTYVIEVMDFVNVDDDASTGGDICLELSLERT